MTSEFTLSLPRLQEFASRIETKFYMPRQRIVVVRRMATRRVKIIMLPTWPELLRAWRRSRGWLPIERRHLSEHEHPAAREGVPPK